MAAVEQDALASHVVGQGVPGTRAWKLGVSSVTANRPENSLPDGSRSWVSN